MDTNQLDRTEEAYLALDLTPQATLEDIERQYARLKRLYEPDRIEDAEDRAYAAAKLAEIKDAYTVLQDALAARPSTAGENADTEQIGDEVIYCANHPTVETLLRCNRCGKPICMKCAVQTPVGYRCKECVSQQQNVYFNAAGSDNLIAFGVGFLVAAIASPIVGLLIGGFGFIGLIIAFVAGSAAGSALAQIIRRAVGRRRGRRLPVLALMGLVLGVLLGNLILFFVTGVLPLFSLPKLLFTALALGSAYPQLR
ncbi:MAG: DnaJ domain-containing protein [Caldilineaceae bacterium]